MKSFNRFCWTAIVLGICAAGVAKSVAQPVQPRPTVPAPAPQPQLFPTVRPPDDLIRGSVPAELQPMGGAAPAEAIPAKDRIRVQLDEGSTILGELPEDAAVTIKSQLGQLEVKLKDVARLDQAVEEGEFRATFASGDRITGKLTFPKTSLKTAWGEVPLTTKGLVSLEAGKLRMRTVHHVRPSPDGRSIVTVQREIGEFVPQVANPDQPAQVYAPNANESTPASPWHGPPPSAVPAAAAGSHPFSFFISGGR